MSGPEGAAREAADHAAVRAARGAPPAISVVVPSYNRRAALALVLEGLAAQRGVAPGAAEVLVVLDGSTDDSAALLESWQRERRLPGLRWHRQANAGQAAARHAGAHEAAAPVLLFVDDDVVPEPDLVARHMTWHAGGDRIAVLGDCEIVRDPRHRAYSQHVWGWWEQTYSHRALPGRLPCYTDFCAGNVSLRRDDYLASGGFDPAFRGYGGEDYDLGYRLLQQGVRFVADRRARGMHHHGFPGVARHVRSRGQEGAADVILARKHPELCAGLRLMQPAVGRWADLAFSPGGMRTAEFRARVARANLYDRLGRDAAWGVEVNRLSIYAYWRGVYQALGSRSALDALRAAAPVPVQTVDVTAPNSDALADFWVHGPSDVRVTAGGELLGTVRVPGPITRPVRAVLADLVVQCFQVPLWLWAERTGTPLLGVAPSAAAGGRAMGTP